MDQAELIAARDKTSRLRPATPAHSTLPDWWSSIRGK
jgi:hypothetical protein